PPVHFGSALSEARTVTVLTGSEQAGGKGDVLVDYQVDDPTPRVNRQVLLTTRVYTAVKVDDLKISTPRIVEGQGSIDKLGRLRVYHSVRGSRRYVVHEQRYTLVPQSTGNLKLSSVEVRGSIAGSVLDRHTKALVLNVLPASGSGSSPAGRLDPRDLFVDVSVDNRSPYIRQQVVYTVRVFRGVDIDNATLSPPTVSGGDAVVQRIGTDRQYRTTRDNRRYSVTERRFVVFPQASGDLTIEPVLLQAAVPLPYSSGNATGFFPLPLTRPVRIRSDSVALNVKPPPAGAPSPWLPAGHVTLEEDWPKESSVKVGSPITRRITVKAKGLLSSELPDLEIPLPAGIKSYPDRPQRNDDGGPDGVTGQLEQTIAVIPSRPGTFTLPGIKLDWWNTATNSKETLTLPSHTLHVIANPAASPPLAAPPAGEAAGNPAPAPAAGTNPAPVPGPDRAWWLSVALGAGWVLTLVLWWRDHRRSRPTARAEEVTAVAVSRRHALKTLRQACRSGDPQAAREALLGWARVLWPEQPPRSLGVLGRSVDDATAAEIGALQRVLYASGDAPWRGEGLYRAARAHRPPPSRRARDEGVLKPLYQR
ncbi:MAG: hypothetical protein WB783_11835, partial [Arenicellales bacterium]